MTYCKCGIDHWAYRHDDNGKCEVLNCFGKCDNETTRKRGTRKMKSVIKNDVLKIQRALEHCRIANEKLNVAIVQLIIDLTKQEKELEK